MYRSSKEGSKLRNEVDQLQKYKETIGGFIRRIKWKNRNNIFLSKRTDMIFDNVNLIHPEITVPGPRSLQHLCRCSLRQRLADNHQLPEGSQNLGLPKVLKEHIDLET
ncbi:hypothetical protein NPIL_262501 [Nephila pilipes]|uniref:SOCS box domain-containing protein n=1 Tax=Nephila pilipes TaxID=299642 RepID=A0A8X6MIL8_NEPPI|nr:hypothetical protein NPIL_262501 [Nephila pilipes]